MKIRRGFDKRGLMVDLDTGRPIVFFDCDPERHGFCGKDSCRNTGRPGEYRGGSARCRYTVQGKYRVRGAEPFFLRRAEGPGVCFERTEIPPAMMS